MAGLRELLRRYVDDGTVAGAVGLVARGDRVEVEAVGSADLEAGIPMARDTIFRFASITKSIVAAAAMMLVEDGRMALDDPVGEWLPELASPVIVRTPESPLDDVVPAARPITVADVLESRSGHGFPDDFGLPAVQTLFEVQRDGRDPQRVPPPDEWMAALGRIPLVAQPGEEWLYNTSADVLGVLIARVAGQALPGVLAERVFEPLGMADTGFAVPADALGRFTAYYRPAPGGGLELVDPRDGQWSAPPRFPSGAGGLVSTADDWLAFARMLLAEGDAGGRRLLSRESVRRMTTNHLTPGQRARSTLFLEGQGWGIGGSVDVEAIDPWNVPGRYGWVGGTGTSAYVVPATGAAELLLTQLEMAGPTPPALMRDFWRHAAGG